MRFMLEASGIDTEGQAGALKVQGLVVVWARVVSVWLKDEDPSLSSTMAALDRELVRGETLAARVDDLERLVTPLRLLARGMMNAGQRMQARTKRNGEAKDGHQIGRRRLVRVTLARHPHLGDEGNRGSKGRARLSIGGAIKRSGFHPRTLRRGLLSRSDPPS